MGRLWIRSSENNMGLNYAIQLATPELLAAEIVESLESALAQFWRIREELNS